ASLNLQATRFKEAPPRRSPEPRCRALRVSARIKSGDRTRLLALLWSFAVDFSRQRSIEGESTVDGRLREKSIVGSQLREKKGRRRGEERRIGYIPPFPASSSPAHRPRPQVVFLSREEMERLPARGERSRRRRQAHVVFACGRFFSLARKHLPARGERSRRRR
ncbi:hypothetical protein GW17_00046194, partial [Ensete ventricosum]